MFLFTLVHKTQNLCLGQSDFIDSGHRRDGSNNRTHSKLVVETLGSIYSLIPHHL